MAVYTSMFVVFNGPPKSGKSTATPLLMRLLRQTLNPEMVMPESFAAPMKHFVSAAMSAKYHEMNKDRAEAVLQGYSVREFLISMSQQYMKPRYGDDIFGRLLHHRVLRRDPAPRFVVIDDGGFDAEVECLPRLVLVRLTRSGTSFVGDSRNFLSREPDIHIANDGTIEDLTVQLSKLANWLMLK